VGGRAAPGGRETDHAAAVQLRGVGGSELLGHENGVLGQLSLLGALAGQFLEHPLPDVAHVVGATREDLVFQPRELVREGVEGAAPGEGR